MQATTFMMKIRVFFTKKKIIWTIIILFVLFLGWLIFGHKSASTTIQTGVVKTQDIQKTVLTTGQVVSSTDLDLSLQSSGIAKQVLVKEGDKVSAGQTLLVLDQGTAGANVESAQGSYAQAEANYNKILSAATAQDVAVTQASVDSAFTALENAKQNLIRDITTAYNSVNTAVLSNTNGLFTNPQSSSPQFSIIGTVQTNGQLGNDINAERINVNSVLVKWQNDVASVSESNLNQTFTNSTTYISTVRIYLNDLLNLLTTYTQAYGNGSQTVLAADQNAVIATKTSVDTAYATITNDNQTIKSAQAALDQAKASLTLKQAPPRPEDIDIAKAQMLSALGALHSAQAVLNNTVLRAPISGTITQVDIKIGEQAVSSKEVMKLLNVVDLHTEALVSESDIASVAVGQSIDNTFDALGPDKHFTTTVLTVNPASTIVSGVVNYKVTGSINDITEIKPGMTANMTIMVAEKKGVLAVPSSAVVNKNGGRFVKVIDDSKKKTYHEVEVQTGLEADGGLTEITSGLSAGQEIVTYLK
ncbi:efflux RND transporter periplasmic adaptor subunit [Candidatus Nomurabacteria bacterium]|nr:efflux RND transporter periplasmic adaptor subunit [Candidatus Nomurabacteria bacterium]